MIVPVEGSLAYELGHNPLIGVSLLGAIAISGMVVAVGVLFAIYSPKKGLVDYLLRTRLMPK